MKTLTNRSFGQLLQSLCVLVVVCLVARPTVAQSTPSPTSPEQARDTAVVSKFISGQVATIGGEESGGARKTVAGDLNHDEISDLVVLYTIEGVGGGNNYTQYLAVFVRSNGELVHIAHTTVGGKGDRSVELDAIKDNVIMLTTFSYAPDDPMCCPSKKGTDRFLLANGKLERQQRDQKPAVDFRALNQPSGQSIAQAARSAGSSAGGSGGSDRAAGNIEVLSDTQGVDFGPYLSRVLQMVRMNWYNIIPEAAKPPIQKRGKVSIELSILPDGKISGMKIVAPSGDVTLDRAAWGGITASNPFPPLPREFHGPFLALRVHFRYNPAQGDMQ